MIIIEGPDGSGKSTFINMVVNQVDNLFVSSSEGPPTSKKEIEQRLKDRVHVFAGTRTLLDRFDDISEHIYGPIIRGIDLLDGSPVLQHVLDCRIPIIYCRPPASVILSPSLHQKKSHESVEHFEAVREKHPRIVAAYDSFMAKIPHIPYDWTNSSMQHNTLLCQFIWTYFNNLPPLDPG